MLAAMLRQELHKTDYETYPAHLHINVYSEFRGQGVGRRLIGTHLDQLRNKEVLGVHLKTTNENVAACKLYGSLGFELLASHPTNIWSHLVPDPVANLVYALVLWD
jgi:ribosomal protein S18 acetylase RimI-like enzyme